MSRRNNQFRLMDQIGSIPEKFIEEAEYTKKELARLGRYAEFSSVISKKQASEAAVSEEIRVDEARTSVADGYKEVETTRKNNVVMIVRIAASVSLVAAGLLLFVFLWNPERGKDPIKTSEASTEQTMPEDHSSDDIEPSFADVVIVTRDADAETEPSTTKPSERERASTEDTYSEVPSTENEVPETLPAEEVTTREAETEPPTTREAETEPQTTRESESEVTSTEENTTQAPAEEEATTETLPTENTELETPATPTAPEGIPTTEAETEPETEPQITQEAATEEVPTEEPTMEETTPEAPAEETTQEVPSTESQGIETPIIPFTGSEETTTEASETLPTEEQETEPMLTACEKGEHSYVVTNTVEPGCIIDGERQYTCTICGMTMDERIPATGVHSYVLEERVEPSCSLGGEEIYVCESCGDVDVHYLPLLGHDHSERPYCKRCGDYIGDGILLPDDNEKN